MPWFGDGARPSRRWLLHLLGAGALVGLIQPRTSRADTPELSGGEFLALSKRLCGIAPADRSLAGAVQAAVAPLYAPGTLRRLAEIAASAEPMDLDFAIAAAGLNEPASRIVAIWYSGLIHDGTGTRVLTYTAALGWAATGFAKPNATCDAGFGVWADAPTVSPT